MIGCPSPQQLEQWLDERLPEDQRGGVTRHVDQCTLCQAALETLTADNGPLSTMIACPPEQAPAFLAQLKETTYQAMKASARSGAPALPAWPKGNGAAPPAGIPNVPGYEIVSELGR